MIACNDSDWRLMRWSLRLSELNYEVIYRPELIHQVLDALSRLICPSDTYESESVDDEIPTFESDPAALQQWLKGKGMLVTSCLARFFEIIYILTRNYTAGKPHSHDNLDGDFNANDWSITANKRHALNDVTVPLFT